MLSGAASAQQLSVFDQILSGVTLTKRSCGTPAFVFIADETPLHRKRGVFESRG